MANLDLSEFKNFGMVDKRVGAGTSATSLATPANYVSIAAMRTRLAAINGTYYTSARLDQMTDNDMRYALRMADDAAGNNW